MKRLFNKVSNFFKADSKAEAVAEKPKKSESHPEYQARMKKLRKRLARSESVRYSRRPTAIPQRAMKLVRYVTMRGRVYAQMNNGMLISQGKPQAA